MKFRDKLQMEHPEYVSQDYAGGCMGCPADYGYERKSNCCFVSFGNEDVCTSCWGREMLGTRDQTNKSVEQLLDTNFSQLIKDSEQQHPKVYAPMNSRKTTGEILIECAKMIAYECKQKPNCDSCVFLDNDNSCVLTDENGGVFPEAWMVPFATLEDLDKEGEVDG